jgi:hypothetical protein
LIIDPIKQLVMVALHNPDLLSWDGGRCCVGLTEFIARLFWTPDYSPRPHRWRDP